MPDILTRLYSPVEVERYDNSADVNFDSPHLSSTHYLQLVYKETNHASVVELEGQHTWELWFLEKLTQMNPCGSIDLKWFSWSRTTTTLSVTKKNLKKNHPIPQMSRHKHWCNSCSPFPLEVLIRWSDQMVCRERTIRKLVEENLSCVGNSRII